jgi:hypothetical protein
MGIACTMSRILQQSCTPPVEDPVPDPTGPCVFIHPDAEALAPVGLGTERCTPRGHHLDDALVSRPHGRVGERGPHLL